VSVLAKLQRPHLPLAFRVVVTVVADLFALSVGYALARLVAQSVLSTADTAFLFRPFLLVTVPMWPAVFACFGLYDLRRPTYLTRLTLASLTAVVVVVLFTFLTRTALPRSFFAVLFATCLLCVLPGRVAIRWAEGLPISR
jgi:FlaA1/EpsC-like NDP-sugar epimerase